MSFYLNSMRFGIAQRYGLPPEHTWEVATEIYRENYLKTYPATDPETLPCIVGDAVLFGKIIWT